MYILEYMRRLIRLTDEKVCRNIKNLRVECEPAVCPGCKEGVVLTGAQAVSRSV